MEHIFTGRKKERALLEKALRSNESEMVSVIGRRRIGKTFLVKHVVFLDELPWLSTHRSGFLRGLSFFWNSWAVNQNIIVVICGSAASWMIQKVVNDKGGLHNRITRRIHLQPFTLSETEEYLRNRNIKLNRYHLVQFV